MNNQRRSLFMIVLIGAIALAFLVGMMTASGGLALSAQQVGKLARLDTQWTVVQASNSLLAGGPTFSAYLPLLGR